MPVQRGYLSGGVLALHRGLDSSTTGMSHYQDHLCAKYRRAVLEASDDLRSDDVPGNPGHKDATNALVEDELDRNARIGTRQNRGEGFLLINGFLLQDLQIFVQCRHLAAGEPLVSSH